MTRDVSPRRSNVPSVDANLSSERELGAFTYRCRNSECAPDELLELFARQRLEVHVQSLDVGDEVLVLHHGLKGFA